MRLHIFKTILVCCLAFCLAPTSFAQKNKIKGKQKVAQSDSSKTDSLPKVPGGKASIKDALAGPDSLRPAIPDSLRDRLIRNAHAAQDSLESAKPDSLKKPRKHFYTRVKAGQLSEAETRHAALQRRIEIAESRLEEGREANEAGEKGAFSKEELDAFALSIEQAKRKLAQADTALVAVRRKLTMEGRLAAEAQPETSAEAGASGMEEEDGDGDDTDGDLPDPAPASGGKGGIKSQPANPPAPSGKGNIKGKRLEEEQDND